MKEGVYYTVRMQPDASSVFGVVAKSRHERLLAKLETPHRQKRTAPKNNVCSSGKMAQTNHER